MYYKKVVTWLDIPVKDFDFDFCSMLNFLSTNTWDWVTALFKKMKFS